MRQFIRLIFFLLLVSATASAIDMDSLLVASVGGPAGLERVKNLKTITFSGHISFNGQPGEITNIVSMPDKLYTEMKIGGVTLAQGYDGQTGWQRNMNGSYNPLSGFELEDMIRQTYMQTYSYLLPGGIPGGKEYLGVVKIDGQPYHEILFTPMNTDTIYGYIEASTGLPTRVVTHLDDLETVTTSSDFRTVEGLLYPYFSRSEIAGAGLVVEGSVDSLAFDEPVDPSIFSMPSSEVKDFHFPPGADRVVLPFKMVNGHIYLEASVNGGKRVRLILDSGAGTNLLNTTTFANDSMTVVGQLPSRGLGGFENVNLVRTDSITIGDLVLYGQTAGMMDLSQIGTFYEDSLPFGGLLGYDFISRFPALIRYSDSTIVMFNPDSFSPPSGGTQLPFDLVMMVPTVEGTIDGTAGQFLIDLGNSAGLILHPHFVASNNLGKGLHLTAPEEQSFGGVGGRVSSRIGVADSFQLGGLLFKRITVIVPDSGLGISSSESLAGNIGNLVLQQFDILLDYANKRLTVFKSGEKVN